jgi:hypothetical protein
MPLIGGMARAPVPLGGFLVSELSGTSLTCASNSLRPAESVVLVKKRKFPVEMRARLECPILKIGCRASNDRSLEPSAGVVRKMATDLGGVFGLARGCGNASSP